MLGLKEKSGYITQKSYIYQKNLNQKLAIPVNQTNYSLLSLFFKARAIYLLLGLTFSFTLNAQSCLEKTKEDLIVNLNQAIISLDHQAVAKLNICLGQHWQQKNNWDSTFHYYTLGIKQWADLDKLDVALTHYKQLILALENNELNQQQYDGWLKFQKGYIYSKSGTFRDAQLAEQELMKAIRLFKENKDTLWLIDSKIALGSIYWADFDTEKAADYFDEAKFLLNKKEFPDKVWKEQEIATWQASNHQYKLMFNRALRHKEHRQVLKKYQTILNGYETLNLPANHHLIALIKNDIGLYYWTLSKLRTIATPKSYPEEILPDWQNRMLDSAAFHYQEAVELWKLNFPDPHRELANTYNNLGLTFHDKYWHALQKKKERASIKNYQLAKQYYTSALEIRKKAQGLLHPEVARNWSNLASLSETREDYLLALKGYHKAVQIATNNFDNEDAFSIPPLSDLNSETQLLYALKRKANLLFFWYKKDQKIALLDASLVHYLSALTITERMLVQFNGNESILNIIQNNWWIYESGIRVALQLFEQTNESKYKEIAWQISERSKSNLTKVALQQKAAFELSIKDKNVANKESELQGKIHQLTQQLLYERRELKDSTRLLNLNHQLFEVKQQYKALSSQLEKQFPQYAALKHQTNLPEITDLKASILDTHSTLIIDFFEGNGQIFVFGISKDSIIATSIEKNEIYQQSIQQLMNAITQTDFKFDWQKGFQDFTTSSTFMFESLILPIIQRIENLPKKLIIIPDGTLNFIPFEILLTQQPKTMEVDYANLSYLLNKTNIQYAYTSSTLIDNSKNAIQHKSSTINYLGLACSYPLMAKNQQILGSVSSIKLGQEFLNGSILVDNQVTKEAIIHPQQKPKVLQISMHSKLKHKSANISGFQLCLDSSEVTIYDFYQADYKGVDLAILTSCETGKGVYKKGEGVSSLAKALSYAECRSTLMSLWKINDQSTASLMRFFYKNLKNGMNKSLALDTAKKSYLKSNEVQKAQKELLHPYYWAGLVFSGKDEAISFIDGQGILKVWSLIILTALVIFFSYFLRNKV